MVPKVRIVGGGIRGDKVVRSGRRLIKEALRGVDGEGRMVGGVSEGGGGDGDVIITSGIRVLVLVPISP